MALEKRGGAVHYYRSRRVGKKVKKVYVASGDDALLAESIDRHRRLQRELTVGASPFAKAEQEAWDAACAVLDQLIGLTDLLVSASLLAEGFHRHKQCEWRRRRARQRPW